MMRQGGMANGRRLVPEAWVRDTSATGGDAAAGGAAPWLPVSRGALSQQMVPGGRRRLLRYRHPRPVALRGAEAQVVIVKMSSQPEPVDDALDQQCIAFFRRLATMY